jgi:hypothetical protein
MILPRRFCALNEILQLHRNTGSHVDESICPRQLHAFLNVLLGAERHSCPNLPWGSLRSSLYRYLEWYPLFQMFDYKISNPASVTLISS